MCRPLTILVLALGLSAPSLVTAAPEREAANSPSFAAAPVRGSLTATPQPKASVPVAEIEPILAEALMRPADIARLRSSVTSGAMTVDQLRSVVTKRNAEISAIRATREAATSLRAPRTHGASQPATSPGSVREIGSVPGSVPDLTPTGLGSGDCCASNDTPGCSDPSCEAAVCAADPFCCDVAWDGLCADQAETLCGTLCTGGGSGPPNDLCSNAIPINVGDVVAGSTIGATGETVPTCGGYHFADGVWYSIVGTGNQITVDTCNAATNYDTILTVFCGDCTEQFCAGWNDDACPGFRSSVTWCSAPGVTYLIYVDGFFAEGNFTLTVSDGPACSNPPLCAPCVVDCPADSVQENETNCGLPQDSVNGGCNGTVVVPAPGNCGTPHAGPGCTDPGCQAAVCAVDPFCCAVEWDAICAIEAQQICGVTTQAGTPISCGQTVCGSGAWDPSIGLRDTDWYEFTITEPSSILWTVETEFQGLIGIIDGGAGALDCGSAAFVAFGFTEPCTPLTVTTNPLLPGSYWGFVAPLFGDPVACSREYTATLECDPLCDPPGCQPCDLFAFLQPLVPPGQQAVSPDHPCFGHVPTVDPGEAGCCETIRNILPLLPGVVDGEHARLPDTHPCWVAP